MKIACRVNKYDEVFFKNICVAYDGTMEAVFSRPRLLVNEHFRGVCGCDEKACIFSSFFFVLFTFIPGEVWRKRGVVVV